MENHARRTSENHVYPRPDLINLSCHLSDTTATRSADDTRHTDAALDEEEAKDKFVLIHDLETGTLTNFAPSSIGLAGFAAHHVPLKLLLLFLRGFASPQWLTTIGGT